MEKIFSILNFGIAIESSSSKIVVYEKKDNGGIEKFVDPTAEVIVELTEEARNLAKDGKASNDELKQKSGEFFDEALAIRAIEKLCPPFSIEYYSCRYSPQSKSSNKTQEVECKVCGSIEHMQSVTGRCPGCGKK